MHFRPIITLLVLALPLMLRADFALSPQLQTPRDGDVLKCVTGGYVNLGTRGADRIWEIPIDFEGEICPVSFNVEDDTVHYIMQGTVYNTKKVPYNNPENLTNSNQGNDQENINTGYLTLTDFYSRTVSAAFQPRGMSYPLGMAYGDSIRNEFTQTTLYSGRKALYAEGNTYTVADAKGKAVIEGDTIGEALGIHIHTVTTCRDTEAVNDSTTIAETITEDSWLLYVQGYRYPVMLSREITTADNRRSAFTMANLPHWQYADLPADEENEPHRAKDAAWHDNLCGKGYGPGSDNNDNGNASDENSNDNLPNNDNEHGIHGTWDIDNTVNVSYTLTWQSEIRLIVSDTAGRPVQTTSYTRDPGTYTETFSIPSWHTANAVMVTLVVDGDPTTIKILKP